MLIYVRNFFVTAFILTFFTFGFVCFALEEPSLSASSSILLDADTKEVLFEKNANEKRSMASTTKIMTALLAVESGRLNDVVCINEKVYIEGTAIGFNVGDKLTVEALCYGMLLESGNDAAVVIANYLAKSEEAFSVMMNEKATEIGMTGTNFVTASGLDDENHYTTAYDMALLGAYAVRNERFREICSTKTYKAEFVEPKISRTFSNHNRLLNSCEGVFGVKTGFTKKSGRCLVSACQRDSKVLIAVTLNAPDDWNDHKKLYDYGYSLYEKVETSFDIPKSIAVYGSDKKRIKINCFYDEPLNVKKGTVVKYKLYLNSYFYAPIEKGDVVGFVGVYFDGELFEKIPVVADENADTLKNALEEKKGFFQRSVEYIKRLFKLKKERN